MLKIVLKNGHRVFWKDEEFDSYEYDGKALCVYKMQHLVGLYNVDNIISVVYKESEKTMAVADR